MNFSRHLTSRWTVQSVRMARLNIGRYARRKPEPRFVTPNAFETCPFMRLISEEGIKFAGRPPCRTYPARSPLYFSQRRSPRALHYCLLLPSEPIRLGPMEVGVGVAAGTAGETATAGAMETAAVTGTAAELSALGARPDRALRPRRPPPRISGMP